MVRPCTRILCNAASKLAKAHHQQTVAKSLGAQIAYQGIHTAGNLAQQRCVGVWLACMCIKTIDTNVVDLGCQPRHDQLRNSLKFFAQPIFRVLMRWLVLYTCRFHSLTRLDRIDATGLNKTKQIVLQFALAA